jgi:hypothetical protein
MNLQSYYDYPYDAAIDNLQNSTNFLLTSQTYGCSNDLYLVSEFIITRQDLASIIAKFLTWFSILIIVFQLIVSPIVDWSYKMTLAKLIYQN